MLNDVSFPYARPEVKLFIERLTADAVQSAVAYTVRPGDSLWAIARRHDTTPDAIRRTNGLGNNRIRPGQVLNVPRGR